MTFSCVYRLTRTVIARSRRLAARDERRRAGNVAGVRQTALKERGFGCEEHEPDPQTPEQIQLADRRRRARRPRRSSRRPARRSHRRAGAPRTGSPVTTYSAATAAAFRRANRRARGDRADHAPAIFDDRAHLRVVEDDVHEHEQHAEDRIQRQADEKRGSFDGDVARELGEHLLEQQRMHDGKEDVVGERDERRQAQEADEVDAAGREELVRPRRSRARIAVEDAARQEQPQQQVAGAEPQERRGSRLAVGKCAEVVEHRGEADDAGLKRLAERSSLFGELAPPLHVDAARDLLGDHAVAEMRLQRVAHHHREWERGQQRDKEDAAEDDGRAIDARDAVAQRIDGSDSLPSALCPLLCHEISIALSWIRRRPR